MSFSKKVALTLNSFCLILLIIFSSDVVFTDSLFKEFDRSLFFPLD